MESIDHHLQRQILQNLSEHEALRFRDLKPDGLENNIFMYHLKLLIQRGLIDKIGNEYTLSTDGLTYVDQSSSKSMQPRLQPKIIAILVVQTKNSVVLLKRRRQPYIHKYMLPSGKLRFGESLNDHAARESMEKLGLDVPMTRCGVVGILLRQKGKLTTHVLATVFKAELKNEVEIHCRSKPFDAVWVNRVDLDKLSLLAGTKETLELVDKSHHLFTEDLSFDLS